MVRIGKPYLKDWLGSKKKFAEPELNLSTLSRTRTYNLPLRRRLLYPVEL